MVNKSSRIGSMWQSFNMIKQRMSFLRNTTLSLLLCVAVTQHVQAAVPVELSPAQNEVVHSLIQRWMLTGLPSADKLKQVLLVEKLVGLKITLSVKDQKLGSASWVNKRWEQGAPGDLVLATRETLAKIFKKTVNKQGQVRKVLSAFNRQTNKQQNTKIQNLTYKDIHQAGLLKIHVQIGHQVAPIFKTVGKSYKDIIYHFVPMHHGLILRRSGGPNQVSPVGWGWPGDARHRNTSPLSQLKLLLPQVGFTEKELDQLGLAGDIILYRFNVIETFNPGKGRLTHQLIRGGQVKDVDALDQEGVGRVAKNLANQIIKWQDKIGSVRSWYNPTKGLFVQVQKNNLASDYDHALALYALQLQHKEVAGQPEAAKYAQACRKLKNYLVVRLDAYNHGQNLRFKAMLALGLIESGTEDDMDQVWLNSLMEEILSRQGVDGRFFEATPKTNNKTKIDITWFNALVLKTFKSQGVDPQIYQGIINSETGSPLAFTSQSIILAALSQSYASKPDEKAYRAAVALRQLLWKNIKKKDFEAGLTWMMLAEQIMLDVEKVTTENVVGRAFRQELSIKFLKDLRLRQCLGDPELGPLDTHGGFKPRLNELGGPDFPDWESCYGLMYMSLCMQDNRIINKSDRLQSILDGRDAVRFIWQLMFDDISTYYVKGSPIAINGVRSALWDDNLKLKQTVMSLIAISQYQIALERFQNEVAQ